MATAVRRSDPALTDTLFRHPYRFEFFQAVRLLERVAEGRVPVGHDGPPPREVVRFAAHLSLSFPPCSIFALDLAPDGPPGAAATAPPEPAEDRAFDPRQLEGGPPPRMTTPFMGLVGPLSALPTVYTQDLLGMSRKGRAAALDFLDLFHHRLVSLFYRAWEKYNVPALWEKGRPRPGSEARAGADAFSRHLFDLIGLGLEPLRDRMTLRDESLLFYTGFFAQQHRPAVSLERLLRDYFGQPAAVISFVGQWLRLAPDEQTRVGARYNALGVDTVAGTRVWDDQSKFRVRLGPLAFDDFRQFLPGGRLSVALVDLVRFFVRGELDFDVQLVLKAAEVPSCKVAPAALGAAQLGRTSWLKTREFTRDADDAVFRARP